MEKFFDAEKTIIRLRVRKIFREPLAQISLLIPQDLNGGLEKCMEIFCAIFSQLPEEQRILLSLLPTFFIAALSVLDGKYSYDRVKFVAEFVISEAQRRQTNGGDSSNFSDD